MIEFQKINDEALSQLPTLLPELLPGGRTIGHEYTCGDIAGNPGKSFKVNIDTGKWADFAESGEKGGDPISLVAAVRDVPQGEAARWLADWLGIGHPAPTVHRQKSAPDRWKTSPAPAIPAAINHPQYGKPDATWEYRSATGALLGIVCRFNRPNGKKEILPFTYGTDGNGAPYWRWKSWPEPRPLYGLDRLAQRPDATVIVTEGEKATDAAQHLVPAAVAVTWPGGCNAVTKTDFSPLKSRRVAIWPDNDEPGHKAAEAVAQAALMAGAGEVFIVEVPPGKVDAWDLADAEAEGWTREQVNKWIRDHRRKVDAARPVELPAPVVDAAEKPHLNIICAADLQPKKIDWLWNGYLAKGKLHISAGPPGAGKTTIALSLAATISSGGLFPDGTRAESGKILIWSGEDDPTDTLLPRLLAMGADRKNIFFIDGVRTGNEAVIFDPSAHMGMISEAIEHIGDVHLLILDPIVNAVAGDSHKNSEVRRALQPVVTAAAEKNFAVIGITHFSKGTAGRNPVERVTGSIAFGALARVVFAVVKAEDEEGAEKRLFVRSKSNIGPDGGGFVYTVTLKALKENPSIQASCVEWQDPIEGEARALLERAESVVDADERNALTEVETWLRDLLVDVKEMDKQSIMDAAKKNGFAERTVQRARAKLQIQYHTEGFGSDKRSMWSLPAPNCANHATENDTQNHGTNGTIEEKATVYEEVI